MRMFFLWLLYKINALYEDYGSNLLSNLWPYYKAWIFLSIIFKLVDMFGFISEGPYAKSSAMLRYTIMPIVYFSIGIPICFYIGWKFSDWARSQYVDYSYFSESGGKIKNDRKLKNDQKPHDYDDDDNYTDNHKEISIEDTFINSYKHGLAAGFKRAASSSSNRKALTPRYETKSGFLVGVDTPKGIDSYDPEKLSSEAYKFTGTFYLQGATKQSVTLSYDSNEERSYYNGYLVRIVSGTGSGQSRFIISYNGETKVAWVDKEWEIIPDDTSMYQLLLSQAYWKSEPASMVNVKASSIVIDGTGTYIRNDKMANEAPKIDEAPKVDEVTEPEVKADPEPEIKIISNTEVEIKPDLGSNDNLNKPKNNLTGDDGEIIDDADNPAITLEELLRNQKK